MIIIGYAGNVGSYAHEAAQDMVERLHINGTLVPCETIENVLSDLKSHEIDYGIVPTHNSIFGQVSEFTKLFYNEEYEIYHQFVLPTRFSLYKRGDVDEEDLKYIAGHPSAIEATKWHIEYYYPNLEVIEVEGSVIAAKELDTGKLPKQTCIICSDKAGKMYNLELLKNNFQDVNENATTFIYMKLKK